MPTISANVTKKELDAIREYANACGETTSNLIRKVVIGIAILVDCYGEPKEYECGVSSKTISRDFQDLKSEAIEWMDALPEGDVQLHHKKSIEGVEQVLQELWKNYKNTKNEGMKLRILALIADKTKMHSEMMNGKATRSMRSTWQSELRHRIKYPEQYEGYRKCPAQKKDNSQEQNV
jgi:hypothetical protein